MSDKVYKPALGFIQFDPKQGDANGKRVRYVAIRSVGSTPLINITVWDQHEHIDLAKGDLIAAEGEYTQNKSGDKTYHNLSARVLVKLGSDGGKRTGVTNASSNVDEDDGEEPF